MDTNSPLAEQIRQATRELEQRETADWLLAAEEYDERQRTRANATSSNYAPTTLHDAEGQGRR
jgi:hypothetical protein